MEEDDSRLEIMTALYRPDVITDYIDFANVSNRKNVNRILTRQLAVSVTRLRGNSREVFGKVLLRAQIPHDLLCVSKIIPKHSG